MVFNPLEWIGAEKVYSSALPDYVIEEKNKLLRIPNEAQDLFPADDMPVKAFIELKLPQKQHELIRIKASECFCKTPPDPVRNLGLLERRIPSDDMLRKLEAHVGQAFLDGATSILDWRFSKPAYLPFWIIPFWSRMSGLLIHRDEWKQATTYLNAHRHLLPDEEVAAIDAALVGLAWNGPAPFYLDGTARTSSFAKFLTNQWLSSDQIDIMTDLHNHRIRQSPDLSGQVEVLPLAYQVLFTRSIGPHPDDKEPSESKALRKLKNAVLEGTLKKVYIPTNIKNEHWVTVYIDFQHKHFGYGDSRPNIHHRPVDLLRGIKAWLKDSFPGTFANKDIFPHGKQLDSVHCGIFSSNAIAHAAFGEDLIDHNNVDQHRMQYFLRVIQSASKEPVVHTGYDTDPAMSDDEAVVASEPFPYTPEWNASSASLASSTNTTMVDQTPPASSNPPSDDEGTLGKIRKESLADAISNMDVDDHNHSNADTSDSDDEMKKEEGGKRRAVADSGGKKKKRRTDTSVRAAKRQMKQREFEAGVLNNDPDARFNPADPLEVTCSYCSNPVRMKRESDLGRWTHHFNVTCPKRHPKRPGKGIRNVKASAGMKSLASWGFAKTTEPQQHMTTLTPSPESNLAKIQRPCPGLAAKDNPQMTTYLQRAQHLGGGGPDPRSIAVRRFGLALGECSEEQKAEVYAENRAGWAWTNDPQEQSCYAVGCERMIEASSISEKLKPCKKCVALWDNKGFRNLLAKPMPEEKNLINTTFRNRASVMGQIFARCIGLRQFLDNEEARKRPCVVYAKAVLDGKIDHKIVAGIIEALVMEHSREERGVGLKNMQYAPAYDEFCHSLQIQSPAAYRLFRSYLPGRSERSFRQKVAREPRFPLEICTETFDQVQVHLKRLGYTGPLALACDDTKLNPSLWIYYDGREECHYLVGSAKGPLMVANPDQMEPIIAEANNTKATKLRLWVLTPELPKVSPIIVHAKPIPNDLNANDLFEMTKEIFHGLVGINARVVSYSADGTDVERDTQALFESLADSAHRISYTIQNPEPCYDDLQVQIPIIEGQPVVMTQDSKHCLKTLRNNVYSGATCLVLGGHITMYQHIARAADDPDSPLYSRDVNKVDRQDDNAASRLFSAQTLNHFIHRYPDHLGDIVYLFVFGELIDAYQNRFIPHSERLRMVLRARYFMDRWEVFLEAAKYAKSKYSLSRQAIDIIRMVVNGYIALMYLHRDLLTDIEPRPAFIPWLHSTEACEHVFGEARRIVKDFTALDFVYMIPKLGLKLRQTVAKAESAQSNTTARGYNHTYLDYHGLNLPSLAIFPSDSEISEIALAAADDADNLFQILGVAPSAIHRMSEMRRTVLPSIGSLFSNDDEEPGEGDEESEDEDFPETQLVQMMIEAEHDPKLSRSRKQEEILERMTCVSVAVMVDEMTELNQSNADAQDLGKEGVDEERAQVRAQMDELRLPPLQKRRSQDDEWKSSRNLFAAGEFSTAQADLSSLVEFRKRHQTRQAEKGTRIQTSRGDQGDEELGERSIMRRSVLQKMQEGLKAHTNEELGAGTGVERQARWTGTIASAGNTANAKQAANAAATLALKRRTEVFLKSQVPLLQDVSTARIGARPLRIGDYGVVYTESGLKVGRVMAIFTKGGGKHGRHEAEEQVTNIARASYITLQLYEFSGRRGATAQFRSTTSALSLYQVPEYGHLPSIQYLFTLSSPPIPNSIGISLLSNDSDTFSVLTAHFEHFKNAMKEFRKRKQSAVAGEDNREPNT